MRTEGEKFRHDPSIPTLTMDYKEEKKEKSTWWGKNFNSREEQ